MKRLARAALGAALLAGLALAVLAAALPRLLASDAVRARVAAAAGPALARELRWERLELGLRPAALVLVEPRIAGPAPAAAPFAEAPRASLRLAPWRWWLRRAWFDRLDVAQATLRCEAPGLAPAAFLELRELAATLHAASPDGPADVEATFALAGGGRGAARGSAAPAGEIDLVITLEGVDLAAVAAPLRAAVRLAGGASGTLALAGPAQSPDRISARLALHDAAVQLGEIELRGPLLLEAELAGQPEARGGEFVIDASQAELVVGRSYRKPAGTPASVRGRFVAGKSGALGVDDVKLHVGEPRAGRSG